MKEKNISFQISTRYFTLGTISDRTKRIWLVLHGYGQLAQYFIRNFDILDDGCNYIIAPEGLFKFYLHGFSGRVGATWMTKEDRLRDIDNNIKYLNCIYEKEIVPILKDGYEINLLGFSQGCATLARWVLQDHMCFDKLIFWAGTLPPDLNRQEATAKFRNKKIFLVYGTDDPFLKPDTMEQVLNTNRSLNIEPTIIRFEGAHKIDQVVLKNLIID